MHPSDIASVVIAVVAVVGLIVACTAWFFRRGGDEREFSVAIRDNTRATDRLTDRLDGVVTTLHSHDIRITKLEATHDSSSADRNAGKPGGDQER